MVPIGQTIICSNVSGATVAYSPWFQREADKATFFAEVIALRSNTTLDIAIQHKNSEDADPAGNLAFFTSITGAGTFRKGDVSGMKELVRFKYTVTAGATGLHWVHFRMTPPAWQLN